MPNVGNPAWYVDYPGATRMGARIDKVRSPVVVDLRLEDGSGRTNVRYYEDQLSHVTPYCFKPLADDNVGLDKIPGQGMSQIYPSDQNNQGSETPAEESNDEPTE